MTAQPWNTIADDWNRFWFLPRTAETLAVMRILTGAVLFYVHAVWTFDLETFFGASSVIPSDFRDLLTDGRSYAWSHFDWFDSPLWLWGSHVVALLVLAMFTAGLWTRVTSVLAYLFVVSYANRATGALFGLDQIDAFLALYLAISNCGSCYSLDQWRHRAAGQGRGVAPTVANNIATRLIQVHMCIVYLFAGLGKLQGTTWWNGEAIWGAIASYEYQTLDLTWLCDYMWLINILTYVAVAWEISYPFLIWPRLTRPVFLTVAVLIHLGIGTSMGMMTFGLIMLIGNLAFVEPSWMRRLLQRLTGMLATSDMSDVVHQQ